MYRHGTERWRWWWRRRTSTRLALDGGVLEEEGRGVGPGDGRSRTARESSSDGEAPSAATTGTTGGGHIVVRSNARSAAAKSHPPATASTSRFWKVGQLCACVSPCGGRRGRIISASRDAPQTAKTWREGQWLRTFLLVATAALVGRYNIDELSPLPDKARWGRLGEEQGRHGGATLLLTIRRGMGEAGTDGASIGPADIAAATPGRVGCPMASRDRDTTAAVVIPLAARWLALVRPSVEGISSIVAVVGREWIGTARTIGGAREAVFVAVAATVVAAVVVAIRLKDGHPGGEGRQTLGRWLAMQRPLLPVGSDLAKFGCACGPAM